MALAAENIGYGRRRMVDHVVAAVWQLINDLEHKYSQSLLDKVTTGYMVIRTQADDARSKITRASSDMRERDRLYDEVETNQLERLLAAVLTLRGTDIKAALEAHQEESVHNHLSHVRASLARSERLNFWLGLASIAGLIGTIAGCGLSAYQIWGPQSNAAQQAPISRPVTKP
jgi:uncharacterized tellurite resistance protein B-like protein